eukprot:TRINITY_DN21089_c0_g1_i1.p1 TRINITY_DN21089_c0_g1~~TRINITY_DN21089_c0_g1_i1.p1  ORF type:complete len:602 (+),score=39.48 TRINITY_DN21089_c0_g1_i1:34-1806(+)
MLAPATEGHTAVAIERKAYIFGGKNAEGALVSTLWAMSLYPNLVDSTHDWCPIYVTGEEPPGRAYHAAVPYQSSMLVFGGVLAAPSTGKLAQQYVLELEAVQHLYAFDTVNCSWQHLQCVGEKPFNRCHHTLTISGNFLLLYGGFSLNPNGNGTQPHFLFDVYQLDLATLMWTRVHSASGIPPTLWGHTAISYDKQMVVFGGVDILSSREVDYMCLWHVDKQRWCSVKFTTAPSARAGHTCVAVGGQMYIFGGFGAANSHKYGDLWVFDLDVGEWLCLPSKGTVPCARSGHAVITHGRRLYLIGGVDKEKTPLADCHVLYLDSLEWAPVRLHKTQHEQLPRVANYGFLGAPYPSRPGGSDPYSKYAELLQNYEQSLRNWTGYASAGPHSTETKSTKPKQDQGIQVQPDARETGESLADKALRRLWQPQSAAPSSSTPRSRCVGATAAGRTIRPTPPKEGSLEHRLNIGLAPSTLPVQRPSARLRQIMKPPVTPTDSLNVPNPTPDSKFKWLSESARSSSSSSATPATGRTTDVSSMYYTPTVTSTSDALSDPSLSHAPWSGPTRDWRHLSVAEIAGMVSSSSPSESTEYY